MKISALLSIVLAISVTAAPTQQGDPESASAAALQGPVRPLRQATRDEITARMAKRGKRSPVHAAPARRAETCYGLPNTGTGPAFSFIKGISILFAGAGEYITFPAANATNCATELRGRADYTVANQYFDTCYLFPTVAGVTPSGGGDNSISIFEDRTCAQAAAIPGAAGYPCCEGYFA